MIIVIASILFTILVVYLVTYLNIYKKSGIPIIKRDDKLRNATVTPVLMYVTMFAACTLFLANVYSYINLSISNNWIVGNIWLRECIITVLSIALHYKIISEHIEK